MKFIYYNTECQKEGEQLFHNDYSIQSHEAQDHYISYPEYQEREQSHLFMQNDYYKDLPDNMMSPHNYLMKHYQYGQNQNDETKYDENYVINNYIENQDDSFKYYNNTLDQSTVQESQNFYLTPQKWVNEDFQNLYVNENGIQQEQEQKFHIQIQSSKQIQSTPHLYSNNYLNMSYQYNFPQCPYEQLQTSQQFINQDNLREQSVSMGIQEQIQKNQKQLEFKEMKQKNITIKEELQKQKNWDSWKCFKPQEILHIKNQEIQKQKPFINPQVVKQQNQSNSIFENNQNQIEQIQFEKQQLQIIYEDINTIKMKDVSFKENVPTSLSFLPHSKQRKSIPLQERIMHMKNLNLFPLVKVSHLYYHQLLKLARSLRKTKDIQITDINEAVHKLALLNQIPKNTATKAQLQLCVLSILEPKIIIGTFNDYSGSKRSKDENGIEICKTLGQLFKNVNDEKEKTHQQSKLLYSLQVIGMYLLGHFNDVQFSKQVSNQKIFRDFKIIDDSLNNDIHYSSFNKQLSLLQSEYYQSKQKIIDKLFNTIQYISKENTQYINEFIESLHL